MAEINVTITQKSSLIFGMDSNDQNSIAYKETLLTVAKSDLIIYEEFFFNLSQTPLFKKLMELEINISKA